jgi:hypothetical protein
MKEKNLKTLIKVKTNTNSEIVTKINRKLFKITFNFKWKSNANYESERKKTFKIFFEIKQKSK